MALDNSKGPARCYGLDFRISYRHNFVVLRVPRNCLSEPRWIRVGQGVIAVSGDGNVYVDDGLRRGIRDDLRLSRRLYRA